MFQEVDHRWGVSPASFLAGFGGCITAPPCTTFFRLSVSGDSFREDPEKVMHLGAVMTPDGRLECFRR